MSYSFRSYMSQDAATSNSSLEKSSLLTPPLASLDVYEVPYKPTDSDRISLNMKRKRNHHGKGIHEVRYLDSDSGTGPRQLDHIPSKGRAIQRSDKTRIRSFSFAHPNDVDNHTSRVFGLIHQNKSAQKEESIRARRWTLPSKSSATRSITPLRSTVKQSTSREGTESPAMITLRRATTNRSTKRTELTFFPEPKFGNQKTGLFSYLVSTLTGTDDVNGHNSPALFASNSGDCGTTSPSTNGTHPTMTFPAPTVYTETTVETDLAMPGSLMRDPSLRRCSTKYISGGSTYEVIWDENDTSCSSHRSSEQFVRTEDRRPSQAVVKLEAQLFRDQTRQSSNCSSVPSNRTSVGSDKMFLDRGLTADKLRQILPRLFPKSSLRDLPRSKGFQQLNRPSSNPIMTGDASCRYLVEDNPRVPNGSIEFFPPLPSRKASVVGAELVGFERRRTTGSVSPPSPRQTRLGSLVGSSSHTRRRSSALPGKLRHGSSEASKGKARVSSVSVAGHQAGDSDIQPLLSDYNPKRQNSRLQGH